MKILATNNTTSTLVEANPKVTFRPENNFKVGSIYIESYRYPTNQPSAYRLCAMNKQNKKILLNCESYRAANEEAIDNNVEYILISETELTLSVPVPK